MTFRPSILPRADNQGRAGGRWASLPYCPPVFSWCPELAGHQGPRAVPNSTVGQIGPRVFFKEGEDVIDPKTKVKQRDAMARRRKPSQIARKRVRRFVQIEPYVDRPPPIELFAWSSPNGRGCA